MLSEIGQHNVPNKAPAPNRRPRFPLGAAEELVVLFALRLRGQWDQLALQSVAYYGNADGSHYYVEVGRGWVGKPTLQMPDEFWQGTGFSMAVKPKSE
jgi:hypothetical protein